MQPAQKHMYFHSGYATAFQLIFGLLTMSLFNQATAQTCGSLISSSSCQAQSGCTWMGAENWCADKTNCGAFWQESICRQQASTCSWMGTYCASKSLGAITPGTTTPYTPPFTSCGGQWAESMCLQHTDQCTWMGTWCADKNNCGAFWQESTCSQHADKCSWMGTWCGNKEVKDSLGKTGCYGYTTAELCKSNGCTWGQAPLVPWPADICKP